MLRRQRREAGVDRFDEVWNGVCMMTPLPNNEHQELQGGFVFAIRSALDGPARAVVLAGANVSDRRRQWRYNFRCPDVAVFLPGGTALDLGTHWLGGPDFGVEIISPRDRARKKLAFYGHVGARELLLVDRNPWSLELYRLHEGRMQLAAQATLQQPVPLVSDVLPLTFHLRPNADRPTIEIVHADGLRRWRV